MNQQENKAAAEEYLAEAKVLADNTPNPEEEPGSFQGIADARDYYLRAATVHALLATIEDDPFVPEATVTIRN